MQLNRKDAGFTLIELLVVVVILGVVTLPLSNAIIGILRNTDATNSRMVLSHDAQISAAYFAQDVASVGTRDTSVPNLPFKASIQLNAAYNAGPTCGTSATPVSVIRFLSDDYDTSTSPATQQTDVVAYYVSTVGSERQLHRMKCLGPSTTPASDVVLVHNLDASAPVVTCAQPTTCTRSSVPQQVTLAVNTTKSGATYPITLNGQRRQS
jgi:prepilin-type N-terminal cleavage/methylation domain-containing protein